MRTEGTFTVASFVAAELTPPPTAVELGAPVGVATMEKVYAGDVTGHSATIFTSAFDMSTGVGTYVAMESFEGLLDERSGGFAYVHSATTLGSDRGREFFTIVPGTGIGDLAGIKGGGGMAIDEDGTHRIWFDYDLA
ncbi:MAG: DUF3224 domain-containing protein [Actinomycetota bacterium]|nr:DUF3224 domain-containing protein [Actinomycetota bacterium]